MIYLSEIGSPTQIALTIPENFIFNSTASIEAAYDAIVHLTPSITLLARDAFLHQDKNAWDTIQSLLFYWNYRDLTRIDRMKGNIALVEQALRKIVLDIQMETAVSHQLTCTNHFTPERAVRELADCARSHRINTHPLFEVMNDRGLNTTGLSAFLESYYVNNRLFHLFVATLSCFTPLDKRTALANNFYDEMGAGDRGMAHPVLFLKNFNTIGRPTTIHALPESLCLANTKTYAAFLSGDYHYGMGGFGYIELTMPNQMEKILNGLMKSGLPKADLEFWEIHITIDIEHGKRWFSEMLQLIETPEQAKKCLAGGISLLDARATMYDGILQSYDSM